MARDHNGANQYGQLNNPPVTGSPFTVSAAVFSRSNTAEQTVAWIGDKDVGNQMYRLQMDGNGAGANTPRFGARNTTDSAWANCLSAYVANTWHVITGVEYAVNSRACFLDGGGKGTENTAVGVTGEDSFAVGRSGDNSPGDYLDGLIAELIFWNVALADAEIAALGRWVRPWRVRPGNIVYYGPYFGLESPEPDYSGNGRAMPLFNAPTKANHAPVGLWTPHLAATIPLVVGGGPTPVIPTGRTKGLSLRGGRTVLIAGQRDDPDGNPSNEYAILRTDASGQVRTTP